MLRSRWPAGRVPRAAAGLAALVALTPSPGRSGPAPVTWEQWVHLPGVFDLAGPRADGRLVAAAHDHLVLLDPASGAVGAFAPGYSAPDGSESYIVLSGGQAVEGTGCSFAGGEVLALDLHAAPPGVVRVSAGGQVSHLATVSGLSTLSGITLDTVGTFGHRLVVMGPAGQNSTRVVTVDCAGAVAEVGTVSTALEGGIAVAPGSFGAFGGDLIAADELDGRVYAVSASGSLRTVLASGLAAGQDVGVESVGFVPAAGAAAAYVADRLTPNNPHPGTDSVLRLPGAALASVDVRPGDALVATEGGDTLLDLRCAPSCTGRVVATGPAVAHGEGKVVVVPRSTAATESASPGRAAAGGPAEAGGLPAAATVAVGAGAVAVAAVVALLLARRRRG